MTMLKHARLAPPMILGARSAADLMSPNPMSIHQGAKASEAAAFLASRGISAAPVIDDAGRPIGVISRTDILVHHAQRTVHPLGAPEIHERREHPVCCDERSTQVNTAAVRDLMTPVVFCVGSDMAAAGVVEEMLALGVRRLFVVDGDGILVGVISAIDVLRKLRRWGTKGG